MTAVFIEQSAAVAGTANLGPGTKVWHQAQIADDVTVGSDCVIGKGAYVGVGSMVGNRVKIQNSCGIFGATLEDDVMLAPGVYLLEDPAPRASTPDQQPKGPQDWHRHPVTVRRGATVGANSTIAPGVVIGQHAMVAICSAVHRDVADHALVAGNPARHVGWVCQCGVRLGEDLSCPSCRRRYLKTATSIIATQPPSPRSAAE